MYRSTSISNPTTMAVIKRNQFSVSTALIVIAFLFALSGCGNNSGEKNGKAIFLDTEFFDTTETASLVSLYEILKNNNGKVEGENPKAGKKLELKSPSMAAIQKKYGKPDSSNEERTPAGDAALVHYYGPYGLCVQSANDDKVFYVLSRLPH